MPTEDKDTTVQDDPKDTAPVTPPTLDEVHRMNQAKVEEEDAQDDTDDEDSTDGEQPDKSTGTDDEPDPDKDDGEEEPNTEVREEPDKPSPDKDNAATPESTSELDEDTSKPGKDKVAIKDVDGKTHYFNNLDEVPDTFEPATYKELMTGTKALMKKEEADEKAAFEAAETARKDGEAADAKRRTDDLQKSWDKDTKSLIEAGVFPKDGEKLDKAKEKVFDYMEKELKVGNAISSFNQAYKSMKYDEQQEADAKKKKDNDDAKKKRGGMVQAGSGGTSPSSPSGRGRVIEAPPSGAGLDAIHARALNSL